MTLSHPLTRVQNLTHRSDNLDWLAISCSTSLQYDIHFPNHAVLTALYCPTTNWLTGRSHDNLTAVALGCSSQWSCSTLAAQACLQQCSDVLVLCGAHDSRNCDSAICWQYISCGLHVQVVACNGHRVGHIAILAALVTAL